MPLRDLKREQTRDALFDAAVELFTERGYDATTVDEIAERAVVSRATAFNYFPKKEDLLLEWAARRRAAVAKHVEQGHGERGGPTQIREAILTLAGSYTSDDRAGRRFVEAWLSIGGPLKPEAWVSARLLGDLVREGRAAGVIRADVDPQAAGRVLLNLYFGALYQWVAEQRPRSWLRKELNAALDVVLDGLSVR